MIVGDKASPSKWTPNTLTAMEIGRYCTGTILLAHTPKMEHNRHVNTSIETQDDKQKQTKTKTKTKTKNDKMQTTNHSSTELVGENVEKMKNSPRATQMKNILTSLKTNARQHRGQLCGQDTQRRAHFDKKTHMVVTRLEQTRRLLHVCDPYQ